MGFLNTILDIVFPVNCEICKKPGDGLCGECLSLFPRALRQCPEWIFPLFDYRDSSVKKAIWLLKYNRKKRLGKAFGEILAGEILSELSDLSLLQNFRDPVLIPIPLSRKRERQRGYNQASLMAKEIEKQSGKALVCAHGVLIKIKETEHQARIHDREKRLENLTGSFAVRNENKIKDKNIILIDDVVTTGATLSEAKKVLREAGARKVIAFTVAH